MDNKNYYEILEIDKNASKEIMDKAYKLLVKKYHPDLQEGEKKDEYEKIIKRINEAYEVLSDQEKRKEYDVSLEETTVSKEDFENLYNENQYLKKELNNINLYIKKNLNTMKNEDNIAQNSNNIHNTSVDLNTDYEQQINEAINKAYYDAYIQDLKNRGYKIKYKKNLKNYFNSFIYLLIVLLILFFIFQIPFIKNYLINLYKENILLNFIINSILKFFQ